MIPRGLVSLFMFGHKKCHITAMEICDQRKKTKMVWPLKRLSEESHERKALKEEERKAQKPKACQTLTWMNFTEMDIKATNPKQTLSHCTKQNRLIFN